MRFITARRITRPAAGCLLEIARAWAALPQKPRRSAIFISVAAEEAGLLGSEYYGQHPVIPAGKTAAGAQLSIMFLPYRPNQRCAGQRRRAHHYFSARARKRRGDSISPSLRIHARRPATYYRSDHFSFARVGIPSFSIDSGDDLVGKPPGTANRLADEYNEAHYHQPSDEYHDDWDFSGMEHYARFGFLINREVANLPKLPTWRAGDEFLAARVASGVGRPIGEQKA